MRRLPIAFAITLALIAAPAAHAAGTTASCGAGQVYTQTNDPAGNQLVVLRAGRDGRLAQRQLVAAGGLGIGTHVTSGASVAVSADGCRVAIVNAGSGAIAVFRIAPGGRATFAGSALAGGARAISVALHGNDVAALSTTPGANTTVRTFRATGRRVTPVPGSQQAIAGATDGGQIAYTRNGRYLVVTTRKSLGLVTFRVDDGVPVPAEQLVPGPAHWPYGFALTPANQAIVSLADFGPPVSGAYASYAITPAGGITEVTPPIPGQTAACWVAVAPDGRYAWGVNADAKELVTLSVSAKGAIAATGTTTTGESAGRDAAVSADGRFLYLLRPDAHDILAYRIGADGGLTLIGSTPTPANAVVTAGIAAG
ncbi:MAG: lactonase family protein [Gaiellales bacterium]